MTVVRVRFAEVPLTVTLLVPTVALGPTLKVRTLVDVVGLVPNEAVTPLGNPEMLRCTASVNPP